MSKTILEATERHMQQVKEDDLSHVDQLVESGQIPPWSKQILVSTIESRRNFAGWLKIYTESDEERWNARNRAGAQAIGVYDQDRVRSNLALDRARALEAMSHAMRRLSVLQNEYVGKHVSSGLSEGLLGKTSDNQVMHLVLEGQRGWVALTNLASARVPLSPEQTLAQFQVVSSDQMADPQDVAEDLFPFPIAPEES
jgi:hypothetical protein